MPQQAPVGANAALYLMKPDPEPDFADEMAFPTPADICAHPDWVETCPVDVSMDGGTETADFSDRCNPDAEIVTKITSEVTFNFRKKKDPNTNELPLWAQQIKQCWKTCGNLYVMMLDESKENGGADGYWWIAQVTNFDETQNLNEGIECSVTLTPSGNTTYKNFDCITCLPPGVGNP